MTKRKIGLSKNAKRAIFITYTTIILPFLPAAGVIIKNYFSEKLSEIQAKAYIETQRSNLGMTNGINLECLTNNALREVGIAGSTTLDKNGQDYSLWINQKDLTKAIIDHEMYHAYRGDAKIPVSREDIMGFIKGMDKNPNYTTLIRLKKFLKSTSAEFKCNTYALFGVKL